MADNPEYDPELARLQTHLACERAKVRELEAELRYAQGRRRLERRRDIVASPVAFGRRQETW